MSRYTVEYYETTNGRIPVEEFILAQGLKMRAKIFRDLELLEDYGSELRLPFSKKIDADIFELRTKMGSNISRIFYFFVVRNKIILTNGFIKKTQKTPRKELELARKYRKDYFQRGCDRL